jgi:hypothetical protein
MKINQHLYYMNPYTGTVQKGEEWIIASEDDIFPWDDDDNFQIGWEEKLVEVVYNLDKQCWEEPSDSVAEVVYNLDKQCWEKPSVIITS